MRAYRPKPRLRSLADREQARLVARYDALRLMAETPIGISPAAALGRNIGLLVGLERDGFAERQPSRDRLDDLVFTITDAGRQALQNAQGRL
jgi:hypothetical protein